MLIYSNESNPATLKLVLCAILSGEEVEIKIVAPHDKLLQEPRHLPYIENIKNQVIFVPNAAAKLLFPIPSNSEEVLKWLDFESSLLSPTLAHYIGSNHKFDTLKHNLEQYLQTLEEAVNNNDFICNEKINTADVIIWCTLYPMYKDDAHLKKEYLNPYTKLIDWIKKLESKPEFQKALNIFKIEPGHPSYHALATGARYILPGNTSKTQSGSCTPAQHVDVLTAEELKNVADAWCNGSKRLPLPKKDVYPVLPVPGERNVLITSALPYVNNVPHLGNIIGCVLSADVFARYCRLCNYNTLFVCGTDEYGTATETKALEEGLTPQQICDKYFEIHNSIYRWFNIGFDYFGRTSTPEQTKLVQEMFLTIKDNGFINTQPVEQLLCEKCNRYLADRFVEGGCPHPGCNYEDARGDQCDGCGKLVNATELKNPKCKICKSTPVLRTSHQFFLDLPKLEPLLLHWIKKSSSGWTNNAQVITKAWMKEGLKPRCITRDLKWGVPVPLEGFKDKVFYVWFDAPIGYMSITERYTKEWLKWWQPIKNTEVTLYQFMAKDNIPFHSVMFPATLLGANKNYTMVSHIMATEYLNYEDGKFSKSRGVGVFGNDAQDTGIPSDVFRFYLLYVRPENHDSTFNWVDLATKNNFELLNNLGNFINRALLFSEKFFDGKIPEMVPGEEDYQVLGFCSRELKNYIESLDKGKLRDGISNILSISRYGNQYMQMSQPWVLIKGSEQDKKKAGTVVGICCNLACLLGTLVFPYMPETSRILRKQLNAPDSSLVIPLGNPSIVQLLPPGHKIGKPTPLFNKIEQSKIDELKKKFAGKQQTEFNGNFNLKELEEAVTKQADKVRSLKSSGVEKSVWQPEVQVLLNLKKKLEEAQKNSQTKAKSPSPDKIKITSSPEDIKNLEEEIEKQGMVVRKLKEGGAEKTIWQPEVDVLLKLKAKLAVATGKPPALPGKTKKNKK